LEPCIPKDLNSVRNPTFIADGNATSRLKLLWAPLLILATAALAPQSQPTERTIEEDVRIRLPLMPCAVPGIAKRIARSVRASLGVEPVPEPCSYDGKRPADPADELVLTGVSLRTAFDRLIELDPRYSWTEVDGVIVMRPLLAWNDRNHFLHRTIPSFNLDDQRMGGALDAIQTALGPWRFIRNDQLAPRTPEGERRFSVALNATSIIEALNAVVREHGALWWDVRYCKPQARYEYATIQLNTFDGSGLGGHAPVRREDGTSFNACEGAR
jgi:hypothetical protein